MILVFERRTGTVMARVRFIADAYAICRTGAFDWFKDEASRSREQYDNIPAGFFPQPLSLV